MNIRNLAAFKRSSFQYSNAGSQTYTKNIQRLFLDVHSLTGRRLVYSEKALTKLYKEAENLLLLCLKAERRKAKQGACSYSHSRHIALLETLWRLQNLEHVGPQYDMS